VIGGNVLVSHYLKGRGPFIARRRLDNYKLIISPRSVGGFHGVRAYSGVLLAMRWTILEKVPGVTALWDWLSFTAKFLWWPM
jgi:hypothetical protein